MAPLEAGWLSQVIMSLVCLVSTVKKKSKFREVELTVHSGFFLFLRNFKKTLYWPCPAPRPLPKMCRAYDEVRAKCSLFLAWVFLSHRTLETPCFFSSVHIFLFCSKHVHACMFTYVCVCAYVHALGEATRTTTVRRLRICMSPWSPSIGRHRPLSTPFSNANTNWFVLACSI